MLQLEHVGSALRWLREDRDLSQDEIAKRTGADQKQVSRWESGTDLRTSSLLRFLDAVGATLAQLEMVAESLARGERPVAGGAGGGAAIDAETAREAREAVSATLERRIREIAREEVGKGRL